MSTTAQAPAPAAPATPAVKAADAQNAIDVVQAGTYVPVFLHKMASAGFSAQNEAEACSMLEMAAHLRQHFDANTKRASSTTISRAHTALFGAARAKQAAAQQQAQAYEQLAAGALQDQNVSAALDVLISMEG